MAMSLPSGGVSQPAVDVQCSAQVNIIDIASIADVHSQSAEESNLIPAGRRTLSARDRLRLRQQEKLKWEPEGLQPIALHDFDKFELVGGHVRQIPQVFVR